MGNDERDEANAQRRYAASLKRAALLNAKVERAKIDATEAAALKPTAPAAEETYWRTLWEKLKGHFAPQPRD